MAAEPDRDKVEAWVGIVVTFNTVMRALETDMAAQHGLPITWFDVLNRLEQAPGGRLRMHELEEVSVFTRSGITRLADRMEEAGLVQRERSSKDRRGVHLSLTSAGRAKLRSVWPDHVKSLEEHFTSHITATDARALRKATAKVVGKPRLSTHLDDA